MTKELKELARKRAELENMLLILDQKDRDLRRRTENLEEKLLGLHLGRDANAEDGGLATELQRSDHKASILSSAGNDEIQSSIPLVVTDASRETEKRIRLNRKTVFSWSYKELF